MSSQPLQALEAGPIPMLDLRAEQVLFEPELTQAVLAVLQSTQFMLGPQGTALEREIATY